MTRRRYRGLVPLAVALAVLAAGARTASAKKLVLVVLDTTGSMADPFDPAVPSGPSRMQVAKAGVDALMMSAFPADTEFALWFFDGVDSTVKVGWSSGPAAQDLVRTTADGAVPGLSTPLARVMCKAVDELIARVRMERLPDAVMQLYLATDGGENSTPAGDQCFGPPSTLGKPPFTPGSWQALVYNKVCTGSTTGAPTACLMDPGLSLIVDIVQIFSSITTAIAVSRVDPTPARPMAAAAQLPTDPETALFAAVVHDTHGRHVSITTQTPRAAIFRLAGDANLDGCVDVLDRAQVLQDFGTPGNGFDDFNLDGVVDSLDLATVTNHTGQCTQH